MSGTDFVFDVGKGKLAEKTADLATSLGVIILRTTALEADATLKRRTTLTDILVTGGSSEPTNTNYARKTGITGTVTIDNVTNDWTTVTIPNQTWAGVLAGDVWAKLIVYYEEAAADGTRIPMTAHSFDVTPNGADITANIPAGGFYKAQ